MRLVIDLDGTICFLKEKGQTYADVQPKEGAKEFLSNLRKQGHYVIISTARNMATCEANVGKVLKNVGKITLEWLDKHEIEYDEIYFGKPNADIYIDDRAVRFESWAELGGDILQGLARER